MDCRKPLVVASLLVCGLTGCSLTHPTQTTSISQSLTPGQVVDVPIKKEEDRPKRDPKAITCVRYGDFAAVEATKPGISAVEVEEKLDVARKAYQRALALDPKCLDAYQGLARLYVGMKDYRHATATYLEAQRQFPKEPSLYYELGMCYGQQKEWEPALQNLSVAASLEPEKRLYNNVLGYALARSGRYDDSLRVFQRLESDQEAHYRVASMLSWLHQDDQARQHLQAALQKDPNMKPALALLSQLNSHAASPAVQQTSFIDVTPQ